jgi:putative ABC transport system permease protein
MALNGPRFEKAAFVAQLAETGIERIQALPGVEQAATSCCIPLEGGLGLPLSVVGRPLTNGPNHGGSGWTSVGPGYFELYRISLLRGRTFQLHRDTHTSTPVVIINQTLAKQLWPKGDPLKDQIIIGKGVGPAFEEGPRQIIGIVGDTHDNGLDSNPRPNMYVPVSQVTDGMTGLMSRLGPIVWLVRTRSDPNTLSSAISKQLVDASGGLPVAHVRTMDEVVVGSTARQSFNMLLLSIFAGSALLLAALGIYALMAYSVQQRTQELGIRMALGASAAQVRNLVVLQGARLALVGVAIGLIAALLLTRFLSSLLFQVKAWDPVVFICIPLLLSAIALIAVWIPARRATVIDPVDSLRYE